MARKPAPTYEPLDAPPSAEELCAGGSLSLREAARFAAVSLRKMESLVASGEVESYLDGSRRLVPKLALVRRAARLMALRTR